MSEIVFPTAFVDVTVGQDHLALTMLETFGDSTVIDLAGDLAKLLI